MPRYKITIAYDGSGFHGWQRQHESPTPKVDDFIESQCPCNPMHGRQDTGDDVADAIRTPLRTVQHVVEQAVQAVVREPVTVMGASRTDAGVHARGQVAAFTTTRNIPVEKLPRAITSRLPDDVHVTQAAIVADDFDPIRHAVAKGYRYRIIDDCVNQRRPLFGRQFITSTAHQLDAVRMNLAARLLIGEHDFASFTRIAHGRESTVRTIYQCKVERLSRRRSEIVVTGNGFLYNMIRIIAGTLVEVGRGAMEPEHIVHVLAARDRRAAGPTLPPNGLCLMWIRYPR